MNRPIRTIMVPLDLNVDTDPIVSWAIEWAQLKRARLVFLHVLPPAHVCASPAFVDVGSYDDLYGLARKHAEDQLLEYASQARECDIEASVHVRVGNAPEEVPDHGPRPGRGPHHRRHPWPEGARPCLPGFDG